MHTGETELLCGHLYEPQGAEFRQTSQGVKPSPTRGVEGSRGLLYGSALVAERSAAVGDAVAKGIDGLDPVVSSMIARASEATVVDAYRAEYESMRHRRAAGAVWDDIDILVLPTTPLVATLADVARDPLGTNEMLGRLTTFANLLDLTCMVVPVPTTNGLVGAGLQFIAPAWHDADVAVIAASIDGGALERSEQACTLVVVGAQLQGAAAAPSTGRSARNAGARDEHKPEIPLRAPEYTSAEAGTRPHGSRLGCCGRRRKL